MATATSALEALKALAKKEKAPAGSVASKLVASSNDPAIAGAKRGKSKTTVTLGLDPSFTDKARDASALKVALVSAQAAFKALEGEVREYGAGKRDKYNDAFKCDVTTVEVPYLVEVPVQDGSDTPGREQRVVQVRHFNKCDTAGLHHFLDFGEKLHRIFGMLHHLKRAHHIEAFAPEARFGQELRLGVDSQIAHKRASLG